MLLGFQGPKDVVEVEFGETGYILSEEGGGKA
jgi:hypothetical protein